VRWAGHVERSGELRNAHQPSFGKGKGDRPLGDDVNGGIILKRILLKCRYWDCSLTIVSGLWDE